jgi:hypothetical protein
MSRISVSAAGGTAVAPPPPPPPPHVSPLTLDIDSLPQTSGAPSKARPYRRVARLGGWVQGMLVGLAIADVISAVVARDSLDALVPTDALNAVGVALLLAMAITTIVMLVWVHRVTANAQALGAQAMPYSPTAAVVWWFVPFANFVMPPKVLSTVAQASHPDYAPGSTLWRSSPKLPIVGFWWAFWLGTRVLGRIVVNDADAGEFWLSTGGIALITGLEVAAMVLGVAVIRKITGDQRSRATRLARKGLLPVELTDFANT